MEIYPDFREFAACANARDVRFLIVGGQAVAFHGHPRYTKDLDVWIERTPENARRLIRALEDFGFASLELEAQDFLESDQVIQLGYAPVRIDLLTSVKGRTFSDCYPRRKVQEVEDATLPYIGLDDLRASKRASGRHQDLADVEALKDGDEEDRKR
jgi:hypothetical protein